MIRQVLLLGEPGLRQQAEPVIDPTNPKFHADVETLHATLDDFRAKHDFGRAISAPQIGIEKRFVVTHIRDVPALLVNPAIVWKSAETFTLWDDCMSFPDLLVRVRRHVSVSIEFQDEFGKTHRLEELDRESSELLQHEVDHLDGVLAVDLATDRDALVLRPAFEAHRARFQALVDGCQMA